MHARGNKPDGKDQITGDQCPCCLQKIPFDDVPDVDLQRNIIIYKGKWAKVSRREAEVLSVLVRFWRRMVGKDMLMNSVYGAWVDNPPSWKALHRHLADIRKALTPLGLGTINEYGIGWSLVPLEVSDQYMKKQEVKF